MKGKNGKTKRVPFCSQVVNRNGEDSGFPSEDEIRKWESNACGIACLRMVLEDHGFNNRKKRPAYWELLSLAVSRGVYCEKGWIHKGLLELAREYGIDGQCHRNKTVTDVADAIGRGSICIVSVTKYFLGEEQDGSSRILPRGGHLVVAYDVVMERRC